ncbi:MAG: hypothetical protein QM725_03760 [Lacibacter sp.]
MKKIIFIFCFLTTALALTAQKEPTRKSLRDEKREGRKEKINTIIRQQEEGALVFNKQNVFGFRLNTDGWSAMYEKGYLKSVKVTNLFALELGEKKHPKEMKMQSAGNGWFSVGSPYVYGKRNTFYQLKPTFGQQRMIGGKANKNGIAVYTVYEGGISVGLLRPYYIRISDANSQSGTKDIKYSQADSTDFLTPGNILSGTGLKNGWKDIQFVPGVHAKAALRFDYGRFNDMVSAIEVGVNVEAYSKKIEIMLLNPSKQVFYNAYVSILLGKRK